MTSNMSIPTANNFNKMISLGIDPGTKRIGYGVVGKKNGKLKFVDAGLLSVAGKSTSEAILDIKKEVKRIIKLFRPDVIGIEKIFFAKNQKTAIAVAEARGVILSETLGSGIKVLEYTPNEIKMGITGYGAADKKSVFKMVKIILQEPELKLIDDASDALALAILSTNRIRY